MNTQELAEAATREHKRLEHYDFDKKSFANGFYCASIWMFGKDLAVRKALEDAVSCFQDDDVLVTPERIEAWKAALDGGADDE